MKKVTAGIIGALVGSLVVMFLELPSPAPACGQSAASEASGWLMATGNLSSGASACFLFDTKNMKLGIYVLKSGHLEVGAVRLCTYDFNFTQYPKDQKPSVAAMKKALEEARKKEEAKKKKKKPVAPPRHKP